MNIQFKYEFRNPLSLYPRKNNNTQQPISKLHINEQLNLRVPQGC